ncbi:(Fe-S)-binding protein [Acidiferrobacter sp.]|jgi:Fe-S oxidoreductase|uniref:(Fe-S)-binding protein n=1 Tax=Acidiferrobacter sp. TaxID=1872107 RepID=UPI00262921FC|nr:(Fe-S)-binding protein [Acidiferrobacter sp.]
MSATTIDTATGPGKLEPSAGRQGTFPDAKRLEYAMTSFLQDLGATAALYLEACVHCGQCAEACHYYVQTGDPKYTPIWKIEPLKKAYKRHVGPFSFFYRLLGLKKAVTLAELESWQELIYDSCTMCGRCALVCPMGIDIPSLVLAARHGMQAAGLVPRDLWEPTDRANREGSPLGATKEVLKERIAWVSDEHSVEIPLDRDRADVLVTVSSVEIMKYPTSLAAIAKVMRHVGASWTFRSDGYEATNFGLLAGDRKGQRDATMRLINAAIAVNAKVVILPECGHAYQALRWVGANVYGKALPFRVLHISEFLAQEIRAGRLTLKTDPRSMTFHDPCQVARRGGVSGAPREIFRALGADLREMSRTPGLNWCCGGGGGVITVHHADPLRYRVFHLKMQQVEETGADVLVSSCSNCRLTFDDGQAHFHWDKTAQSLLEIVANNLAETH